jgi:hypothetical protein
MSPYSIGNNAGANLPCCFRGTLRVDVAQAVGRYWHPTLSNNVASTEALDGRHRGAMSSSLSGGCLKSSMATWQPQETKTCSSVDRILFPRLFLV